MSNTSQPVHHERFPWMHIMGYVLSIVLTAVAFWLVLAHEMKPAPTLLVIVILAVLQIFVQLFFFMHITESDGPAWHTMMLVLGFFFVVVIVAGSIWIMSFNSMAA